MEIANSVKGVYIYVTNFMRIIFIKFHASCDSIENLKFTVNKFCGCLSELNPVLRKKVSIDYTKHFG